MCLSGSRGVHVVENVRMGSKTSTVAKQQKRLFCLINGPQHLQTRFKFR